MKFRTTITTLGCAALFALASATHVAAQTITWQALPFPSDSDWPSWTGHPSLSLAGQQIYEGRAARTVQTFSAPKTIVMDVTLEARTTDDGALTVHFIPTGLSTNTDPDPTIEFDLIYRGTGTSNGTDGIDVAQRLNGVGSTLWGEMPFVVQAGHSYHLQFQLTAAGLLTVRIDGVLFNTGVTIPYKPFQIQIGGWQPMNRWTVRNFKVR